MARDKKRVEKFIKLSGKILGALLLAILALIFLCVGGNPLKHAASLNKLQSEFSNGFAKLKEVFPRNDWDEACLVRIYSDLKDPEVLKKYFGENYKYNVVMTPNPSGARYAFGFSFLENRKFVRFVEFPSLLLNPIEYFHRYKKIGWFVPSTVEVLLPEGQVKQLQISSFDFKSQKKDDDCFSRSSGFIQIIDHRKILIGE